MSCLLLALASVMQDDGYGKDLTALSRRRATCLQVSSDAKGRWMIDVESRHRGGVVSEIF